MHAQFIHNDHLVNAMHTQAFAAISTSPGARAYYDELRSRDIDHADALRRLANRQAGILHGCLKTGTDYDEHTAWGTAASQPVYLASSREVEGIAGRYYASRNPTTSCKASYDTTAAARLWQASAGLASLTATA